ncbi:MAG: hypothetical protein ACOH14_03575 [Rhodoglobus sp.]
MKSLLKTVVTAVALSAIAATIVSCSSEGDSVSAPSFAYTSADIVFAEGPKYPINLIFVAKGDDPIWDDLSGVELSNDLSVGPGEFDVIRGDGSNGDFLGNITFELDIPDEGIGFESVGLVYSDKTEPVPVEVGSWSLRRVPQDNFATDETNAEVAAMADCSSARLPIPSSVVSIDEFRTGSDQVDAPEVALSPEPGTITIVLSCTGDADFYVISPTLDYTDNEGQAKTTRFSPITIGLQEIDDEDLKKIRDR